MDTGDQYTLYHGDCLDVLPTLAAGSVDAVVTDPPFGIGFKYATHEDTPIGYGEWIWKVISAAERLCKPGSPVFIWQAMLNVREFTEWFPREWRIFAACKSWVQMRPTAMQYAFDPVLVWWTPGDAWTDGTSSRDFHVAMNNPSLRQPGFIDFVEGHPCPRPLDQVRHMIRQWARPGGVVFDPFMGSGTTGVAAILEGRNFVGVELDAGYYDIARRRIEDAERIMRHEFKQVADDRRYDHMPIFAGLGD